MARRSDIALSTDMIRKAAFAVLEDEGLDKLTMRALAKRLKVQAPAIYSYYKDKSDLLSDMATEFYVRARAEVKNCDSASSWLEQFGLRFYDVLITTRDAAKLFSMAEPAVRSDILGGETAAQPLLAFGLSIERAIAVQAVIIPFALGTALDHSNVALARYLKNFFDPEAGYREGIRILAAGLAAPGA